MLRSDLIAALEGGESWDVLVVGGGATGLGCAVDASSRGYRTLLVEQHDFAKGTSSRSTKLIHGGLRYLAQGQWRLVRDALHERTMLLRNAPHVVEQRAFVVPCYSRPQKWYYGTGVKLYDWLARSATFGPSRRLTRAQVEERFPILQTSGLVGGVLYYDGQFDDARLAVCLARTAAERGATVLNYVCASGWIMENGRVVGARLHDQIDPNNGGNWEVRARVVINATGIFADRLRREERPDAPLKLAHSQGAHLVLDAEWLPGDAAILIPKTSDGRVLFAIPWHRHVLVGTTDIPVAEPQLEPRPMAEEIEYLLDHLGRYFHRGPDRSAIRSAFAGIRPLVRAAGVRRTSRMSRDHVVEVSPGGLVSVMGGKWTTYRRMAEDTIDRAAAVADLKPMPCTTRHLPLAGNDHQAKFFLMQQNPAWEEVLDHSLDLRVVDVVWAAREEWAQTVEDVLARRHRALFLDARAAGAAAPRVAQILAEQLGRDKAWINHQIQTFQALAKNYQATS